MQEKTRSFNFYASATQLATRNFEVCIFRVIFSLFSKTIQSTPATSFKLQFKLDHERKAVNITPIEFWLQASGHVGWHTRWHMWYPFVLPILSTSYFKVNLRVVTCAISYLSIATWNTFNQTKIKTIQNKKREGIWRWNNEFV